MVILYIDDDPDIRVIVSLALSLDKGITFRVAGGATEALDLVANGFVPDLALLDVMMPDVDGPELLDRFRRIASMQSVPVIFMTAKTRQADVAMYRARGAAGVISKPFDPLTLAADIRQIFMSHATAQP